MGGISWNYKGLSLDEPTPSDIGAAELAQYADYSSFPASGETNTLYIALDSNSIYYWDGSAYKSTSSNSQGIRVVTAAGDVTVTAYDDVIIVNKSSGAATAVNLPAGVTGREYIIKDGKGDAATNNITITPAAGTIDGSATFVMNVNYGSATIVYNGTEWNII